MTQETNEEAAESRYGTDMDSIRGSNVYDLNTDLKRGFIEGAKWQQERMYSREDIENIWNEFVKELPPINNGASSDFLVYLKEFKKK